MLELLFATTRTLYADASYDERDGRHPLAAGHFGNLSASSLFDMGGGPYDVNLPRSRLALTA